MSRSRRLALALGVAGAVAFATLHAAAAPKQGAGKAAGVASPVKRHYGIGRPATPEEIAGWDIDVRPDGQGLPPGKGSVKDGEDIYVTRCAACHGEFGEGAGRFPPVAGGHGSLASHDPDKTVGSYFPYLSTLFDYTRHAMPFGDAQSLTNDQLYAVVAYVLHLNDVVDEPGRLLRRRSRADREGVLDSVALHAELQERREDHRPRTRARRHTAGGQEEERDGGLARSSRRAVRSAPPPSCRPEQLPHVHRQHLAEAVRVVG